MYTEYVFDNKKYDVASRDIKATLFEIVTTEESNIAKLREKAFIDATDPQEAAELQNLYVQQDACLREILAIADKLTKSLQRVDACSRKLKQIEDKNVAQIIANIRDVNEAQQLMAIQNQPADMETDYQNEGEPKAEYSGAADVAMAPEPVDEPIMTDQGENNLQSDTPAEPTMVSEDPTMASTDPTMVSEEPVMVPEDSTVVSDSPIDQNAVNDAPVEIPGETVDNPGEMTVIDGVAEPTITDTNEVGEVEVPTVTSTDVVDVPIVDAPAGVVETPMDVADASSDVALVADSTDASTNTPVVAETVSEPVMKSSGGPLIIPTGVASTEGSGSPLIIPTGDMSGMSSPVIGTTSTDLITSETPNAEDAAVAETPATEPATGLGTIPVITISSDGPLEAVSGPLITPTDESSSMVLPDIVPGTPNANEAAGQDASLDGLLVFKKRTNDPPKVIMISKAQATKLNQSLSTQEALISAKGYFGTTASDQNLEQQLMNSGLLATDVSTKQAQIEQMMNQANELYAAGKVEEAQEMYNQISVLNKELQESAGITR